MDYRLIRKLNESVHQNRDDMSIRDIEVSRIIHELEIRIGIQRSRIDKLEARIATLEGK